MGRSLSSVHLGDPLFAEQKIFFTEQEWKAA